MSKRPDPLDASEAATLNAQYVPLLPFEQWPKVVERPELWEATRTDLDDLREAASEKDLSEALELARRAAAFDTGAIESLYKTDRGLTLTVATQAGMWESRAMDAGRNALALFEAQLEAYELVLDAATRSTPLSQAWIRRLHEVLTGPQETYSVVTPVGPQEQPLPHGEYKHSPNHVALADGSVHAYAPVDQTSSEMARLIAELQSPAFSVAHPALQAAYAHYGLVAIHPFADGNGRVARALASVYLYRDLSVPLLIFADQRDDYFDTLGAADKGDYNPFTELVFNAGRAAAEMAIETVRSARSPSPEEALAKLRALLMVDSELSHAQLDTMAVQLTSHLRQTIQEQVDRLLLPPGVKIVVHTAGGGPPPSPPSGQRGFRPIADPSSLAVAADLESPPPARAQVETWWNVMPSTTGDGAATFRIVHTGSGYTIDLGLRDAQPAVSASAQHRLDVYAARTLGEALNRLLTQAGQALG